MKEQPMAGAQAAPSGANGDGILARASYPFRQFAHNEAAGGVLLLATAVIALVWANSPLAWAYENLWSTQITVGTDGFNISKSLQLWVNDGLMAVFFFVVGMEIKRELLVGELASPRRAALPAAAALGGAVVPALIYTAINAGGPGSPGWGIPMATDIAFALGVLALLGNRVPPALKVLLAAVAIVDDLLAVLVIAIFYTAEIALNALLVAAGFYVVLVLANRLGVRTPLAYGLLGIGLWLAVLKSGVHATIAGVLLATTIPAWTRIDQPDFVARARELVDSFAGGVTAGNALPSDDQQAALAELEGASRAVQSPLQRLENALHPAVAFVIMPVFALANAGVNLSGDVVGTIGSPIALGIILGLVVGKQIGITLAALLATRLGLASLPEGVGWKHIYGMAWLGGIGFTMSLFIASLAFGGDDASLTSAKIGILLASAIAGAVGFVLLSRIGPGRA
jgi:NhaA family Na+:H+ antiporter